MQGESTVNWERVRLGKSRNSVSGTTLHGWPSILFGLPFAGVGVMLFLVSQGVIGVDPKSVHAPMWMIGLIAGLFFLAGAYMMVHGVIGLGLKKKVEEGRRRSLHQPWLWDYVWDPLGVSENKLKEVMKHFAAALTFIAFLAPFHYMVWFSEEKSVPTWVKFVVIFFDFIVVLIIGDGIRKYMQFLKYGNSRLRFLGFPFHLGEKMKLALEGMPAAFDSVTLNLRYIEEVYETRYSGRRRTREVVCYQIYGEERTMNSGASRSGGFLMEWDLPDNKEMTTELSGRPGRFWEIEIKAETPGVDYDSRFLVPVYAKP
ncbi:hypothetical protein [Nitrospina watsonii]|uniref:Uncharacterized protein n=1 Tax=Nitrospina watsonii TaxID=1323948 RepID=A0ABM9HD54_9BACT|nr:hypothetical protein [Nitrospina watsonii]CAI2718050.1 membrane protein of unknown function [Nitrospina watsonii]